MRILSSKIVFMLGLDKIKKDIFYALELVGLDKEVALDEIEKEILKVNTAFQSLLILGILRRIMQSKDDKAAKLFIPAVTEWKNYMPHKELGGLSPAEAMEKYPPGPQESYFITAMMDEYQRRLEELGKDASPEDSLDFDVESDFSDFQDGYLNRIPSQQAFTSVGGHLMTIKEIIMEERRRAGHPEEGIDKIGVKIFAENTAEGAGVKMAKIEDEYMMSLQELEEMRQKAKRRNKVRIRAIRKQFEKYEPYHRCGPAPHQFYLNYAAVVLLDGGKNEKETIKFVLSLLDRSLAYKPDYEYALKMKHDLQHP